MLKRSFQSKNLKLNFNAIFNNKIPYIYMFIKIDTKETLLLKSISYKYHHDFTDHKIILDSIPGKNGIIIQCIDKRITSNILKYISYLKRCQLKTKQILGSGKCDYSALVKDLNNIDITLIGNCRTFIKNNLHESVKETSKKIDNLLNAINHIEAKPRDTITSDNIIDVATFTKLSNIQIIDMSIIFKDCDIEISGDTFKITKCKCGKLGTYSDTFKSQLKFFRQQFGGISASDEKNAKKKDMINCVIVLSQMFTELKGSKHSLTFKDIISVESDSVKLANNIIKSL